MDDHHLHGDGPDGAWFQEMAEASGDLFFILRTHPSPGLEFVSGSVAEFLGHSATELCTDPELLPRCVAPESSEDFAALLAMTPGASRRLGLCWVHKQGHPVWTVNHVRCRQRRDGSVVLEGTAHDVTELREAEQALAASEESYRLLAENAYDVIWTMAVDGTITYVSPSVLRVRGFTPEEAAVQRLEEIHPPASQASVLEYYTRLTEAIIAGTEPPIFHGEHEYYRKDGSIMLGDLQVIPQVDAAGQVVQVLGVTRDISERRNYEQELQRLATTDQLTMVWNRRQAEALLEVELVAPPGSSTAALLMVDVDHFKSINDTYGHQTGDRVLVEVARRLRRAVATAGEVARWGGEEFVVIAPAAAASGRELAEHIRGIVGDTPFDAVGQVTASIGVAVLRPGDDLDSWLHRADTAMYRAKAAGRNAVRGGEDEY